MKLSERCKLIYKNIGDLVGGERYRDELKATVRDAVRLDNLLEDTVDECSKVDFEDLVYQVNELEASTRKLVDRARKLVTDRVDLISEI